MKLTQVGLLTLGLMTFIQAEIYIHKAEALKNELTQAKHAPFAPKIEIKNNLTTIIPEENTQVSERTTSNPHGQNVTTYVLPKINKGQVIVNKHTKISFCGEKTYLVSIGINESSNIGMKLQEAVNDAKKIEKKVKQNCTNTQTHLLLNQTATKENILEALANIKEKATKKDAIIFFYSGNGFNFKDQNYVIAYDSEMSKNMPLINSFLSQNEVTSSFKQSSAKKGLMIFDACTSRIDNNYK